MKLNTIDKLNPIYETLGLIYYVKNYDKLMKEAVETLNNRGINGELFIKNNLKVINKYVKEFKKHMVINYESEFLIYDEEEDRNIFFIILFSIVYVMKNYKSFDNISEDELRRCILQFYLEMADVNNMDLEIHSLNDIFYFIEKQDMSNKNKWMLMKLLNNPKKYINQILKLIEDNKFAYEESYKVVEKQLTKLIKQTETYVNSEKFDFIQNMSNNEGIFELVPTLVFGGSIFELKNIIFIGVLAENVFEELRKSAGSKGDLVLKLKAISDNSKLETISLLKMGPKYSLEIAESLKLTPATVSYHMSTLLENGLVSVEKKHGKVYYYINKDAMEKFLHDLSNALL